jgi:hypothetical protein
LASQPEEVTWSYSSRVLGPSSTFVVTSSQAIALSTISRIRLSTVRHGVLERAARDAELDGDLDLDVHRIRESPLPVGTQRGTLSGNVVQPGRHAVPHARRPAPHDSKQKSGSGAKPVENAN